MGKGRVWLLVVAVWALSACVDTGLPLQVVVQQGNEYMEALKQGDMDKVFSFYSPKFFTALPEEGWREYLQDLHAKLGDMKSYSLMAKSKDTRFSGIFYILRYKTVYENGDARETVTFVEPVEDHKLKVFAHKIEIRHLRKADQAAGS